MRVHIWENEETDFATQLSRLVGPTITLSFGKTIPEPALIDILVCGVPDEELIKAGTNLNRLIIPWSGLPKKTGEMMRRYPHIAVHNIHHNRVAVAEMAIALMMAVAKQIIPAHNALRKNDWSIRYKDNHGIRQIAGKRALIIGYGAIGKEIAIRLNGLGAKVAALNSKGSETQEIPIYPISDLHQLLPTAELLFLSLPLTPDTTELIGVEELSLLPHDAILINISRGAIVNQSALYQCLKEGSLRAGLDVWYQYPDSETSRTNTKPSQYQFADLPNVIMTPHLAGHSDQAELSRSDEIAHLLNLAKNGEPLPNLIDLRRGY